MKNKTNSSYAVITGASQGLGKAFAFELARLGRNVVLVSLPGQSLQSVVAAIKEAYNVEVAYFETDFACNDNIMELCEWLNSNFSIDILINNAGVGGTTRFTDVDVNYIETIIQVNVKATAILTHQLLSNLKRQPCSYILNVSSIAAFTPVGYKTVYPASKVFVHYFARGLRAELKDSNISVSVIHPGAMATNPEIVSRIEKQGFIGKLTLLKPEKVAQFAISRLLKKDSVIVLSHLTWVVSKLMPEWLTLYLMTGIVKREINNQLV
ncbi:SDR family NAD(P)-dependent oxidoreductase [Carboxylicivirga taeanensis]|uniref:SDR family NAD(P)-dependent oxidoreductase n=1 Tax=Carboxylicivirga taeanensis TaxID=1416875 RepID=UPI003F6DA70D